MQLVDAPGYERHPHARAQTPSRRLAAPIQSEAAEEALADAALKRLAERGADYGDLRLGRDLSRYVDVHDTNITVQRASESEGMGVRALVKGFWGFAATPDLTEEGVRRAADRAFELARAVAATSDPALGLPKSGFASEPAHKARFDTPVVTCPFEARVEEIATPLIEAARRALAIPGVSRAHGFVIAHGRRRLFASTEGARILTTHCVVDSQQRYVAVDSGTSAYRTSVGAAVAGGLEHVEHHDYPGQAEAHAREALMKCRAKKPDAGRYDLILDPHNLALTMHESVGHPTELDRVLGYELGFAGGSFASLDKLGSFRYGSPIVNFTADNRLRFGGASSGYDDEGVECQSFPIIREGVLVGYGTSRETAHAIGLSRSNGTCRSTGWHDAPIVRIPNLFLEPGRQRLALAELIQDTKSGILMLGRDSFSIDQMRYNFQFGADMCWRIENGKLVEPLRDVIYQSISPEFWGACDAVCDEREWRMHGVFNCGKGQPMQAGKMMHGASPARFRQIRVGY
jgi:TldD protein